MLKKTTRKWEERRKVINQNIVIIITRQHQQKEKQSREKYQFSKFLLLVPLLLTWMALESWFLIKIKQSILKSSYTQKANSFLHLDTNNWWTLMEKAAAPGANFCWFASVRLTFYRMKPLALKCLLDHQFTCVSFQPHCLQFQNMIAQKEQIYNSLNIF